MPFQTPNFEQITDALLRDIQNLLPEADTGADSDYRVRASSVASAVEGLYQHQQWITRQLFPDSADTDYLERHASLRGLTRKSATTTSGSINFSGAAGSLIPTGTQAKAANGQLYATTVDGTVEAGGSVPINAQAQASGSAGNQAAGATLTLLSPPAGVSRTATVASMVGGVDSETDAQLLARLLDLIRRPPTGGNKYDYARWALEVEGVSAAYVYPLRRGLGTVDIVIASAGGLPAQTTLDATQAHIDDLRPVSAEDSLVISPTLLTVNVTGRVTLSGATLASVQAQISDALGAYFDTLAPGDAVYKSRIEAIISDIPGVVDRIVTAPAANVAPVVDATKVEWARLGAITLTEPV